MNAALSLRDCAELAGLSYDTVARAVRAGRLPASRPTGSRAIRVRPEDFEAWLYGTPVEPAPQPLHPAARSPRSPERGSFAALQAIEREEPA